MGGARREHRLVRAEDPVDPGTGQVTFQVLPGTNTFTAWDAGGYQTRPSPSPAGHGHLHHRPGHRPDQRPSSTDLAAASVAHAGNTGWLGRRPCRPRQRPGHLPGAARHQHLHRLGRQRLPDPDRHRHGAGDRYLRHRARDGHRLEERQPADHGTGGARREHRLVRAEDRRSTATARSPSRSCPAPTPSPPGTAAPTPTKRSPSPPPPARPSQSLNRTPARRQALVQESRPHMLEQRETAPS